MISQLLLYLYTVVNYFIVWSKTCKNKHSSSKMRSSNWEIRFRLDICF